MDSERARALCYLQTPIIHISEQEPSFPSYSGPVGSAFPLPQFAPPPTLPYW